MDGKWASLNQNFTNNAANNTPKANDTTENATSNDDKLTLQSVVKTNAIDNTMGFACFVEGDPKLGWLVNMHESLVDDGLVNGRAALDLYFLMEDGQSFKATIIHQPYFYVLTNATYVSDVDHYLRRLYKKKLASVEIVQKDDLSLSVRQSLLPIIERNLKNQKSNSDFNHIFETADRHVQPKASQNTQDHILELREHDITYYTRVTIDQGTIVLEPRLDLVKRPDPVIFAFDIETTKLPLKFPDAAIDSIMMISYMIDGELALLKRFFDHIILTKPTVFVTYNGDFFDWPFIEARSKVHGLDMKELIGFERHVGADKSGIYLSSYGSHMDCFYWVKRDSYLPQGSQGLKAVATYKLGYNPVELDPEDMTRYAAEKPQILAQYSVSDAVATYYLYMKYVHPFTFSLCNIIPMNPDDVLRKGSGTLCENLLMVQAFKANVIMPNKHVDKGGHFFEGHLIDSETYVGGHVEALEAGIFRSDIPMKFKLSPAAFQQLIDEVDQALTFTITQEGGHSLDDIENYDEVKNQLIQDLSGLRDTPNRTENPSIYHLDVGAITCASCDFNEGPGSSCQRKMEWSWRGEYFVSTRGEYNMVKNQLESEKHPPKAPDMPERAFHDLSHSEQDALLKKRISDYTRKVYGKTYETKVIQKESIVCQRENPFYINTVRAFRDRRYEYKALLKTWKKKLAQAIEQEDVTAKDEASKMTTIFDSLQTAHKCILNSFYGYVMRKGARWYSMEMAGIVCLTGAKIIQLARLRVEQIGRPLELDTDGIWCTLPASFPENFTFKLKGGKSYTISYPCVMLNHLVHDQFTNHQYQELKDPTTLEYVTRKENSIFFEVDEDKLLKKRYAVFNHDGTLAELKGFEVKRRGELKLVKNFQSSIFKVFLEGKTLEECYASVANVSNRWLDILYTKGCDLTDSELFDLLSENRSMSKSLSAYGDQKSSAITTAKRLAEFLGDQMVRDKGLNCKFVIVSKPFGEPVSKRAIPVAIFYSEPNITRYYLRKWLKDHSIQDVNIRDLIDWEYYLERFGAVIQKLITIPAAFQDVENPIPRIIHPDWLRKRISAKNDKHKQVCITDMFAKAPIQPIMDIESLHEAVPKATVEMAIDDVEDVVTNRPLLPNGKRHIKTPIPRAIGKKKGRKQYKQHSQPNSENPHDPFLNYPAWLSHQRTFWKLKLKSNRNARRINPKSNNGILNHFVSTTDMFYSKTWELLQISETDSPGIFRLWTIVNGQIESVDIEVPRVIYVNSRIPDADATLDQTEIQMTKLVRTLPRNHKCLHLYQMKMTELFYRNHASMFSSMFNHKDIEGVYESQVPLLFRALTLLGTFGKVVDYFDPSQPLKIDKIEPVRQPSSNYLTNGTFNIIYFFHTQAGSRQTLSLFVPFLSALHCVFVDPGVNRDAIPAMKRLYSEMREKKLDKESEFITYADAIDVTTNVHATEKETFTAINKILLNYKGQGGKPLVLLFQSPKTQKYFRNAGMSSFREYPILSIPSHKSDSDFPALGWQTYSVNHMLEHLFNLTPFLTERIEISRYSNVPICNIEQDYTIFLSDLFLARRLQKMDVLLWCSNSVKPDLGGSEQDDNKASQEDLKCPEINNPGTYDTISIELEVWDLCLNTILKSSDQAGDLESMISKNINGNKHLLDDHFQDDSDKKVSLVSLSSLNDETPINALNIIRQMIKGWNEEVRKGNRFASHLLSHLQRWLTTSSAYFYDILLVQHLFSLMKRTFLALLEELTQLGSQVIFASFDKLILATSKKTIQTGVGYISYVVAAIAKLNDFKHIELKPLHFWDHLIWYDSYNFGCILYQPQGQVTSLMKNMNSMVPIIDLTWNISDYLPNQVQTIFLKIIAEYLYIIQQCKEKSNDTFLQSVKDFVSMDLKRKLFGAANDIFHHRLVDPETGESQLTFPNLPGSCRPLTNPALEFIKMICMVLSLDQRLENDVRVLKRDLLKLIDIKEFNSNAVFQNPCERYVLSQVICSYCNHCCDLDLTRQSIHSQINQPSHFLTCEGCMMAYDLEEIEQRLIQHVHLLLLKWQNQDLTCLKCRFIKAEELRSNCIQCTGDFKTMIKKKSILNQILVLKNLSKYFMMYMLEDIVEFCLTLEN
ncbi:DNA polymerase epsilon catalytic subunit [Globomyces sp. JEL0801]|nr:DNA polymerase epsilon catalytic subunit [Globomyces sp. JEL0801]